MTEAIAQEKDMTTVHSEKSLEYQLERNKHKIVQRLADQLQQRTGIESAESSEQDFDWEAHLSLYYQHFTQALIYSNPQIFLDFLSWARKVQKSRGMSNETYEKILRLFDSEISSTLDDPEGQRVTNFFHSITDEKSIANGEPDSYLKEENEYGELAVSYFSYLMDGDRRSASRLILDAVEKGVQVKDIYMHVFQPSQYEVGRLW